MMAFTSFRKHGKGTELRIAPVLGRSDAKWSRCRGILVRARVRLTKLLRADERGRAHPDALHQGLTKQ